MRIGQMRQRKSGHYTASADLSARWRQDTIIDTTIGTIIGTIIS
jgi:hypothetical protein